MHDARGYFDSKTLYSASEFHKFDYKISQNSTKYKYYIAEIPLTIPQKTLKCSSVSEFPHLYTYQLNVQKSQEEIYYVDNFFGSTYLKTRFGKKITSDISKASHFLTNKKYNNLTEVEFTGELPEYYITYVYGPADRIHANLCTSVHMFRFYYFAYCNIIIFTLVLISFLIVRKLTFGIPQVYFVTRRGVYLTRKPEKEAGALSKFVMTVNPSILPTSFNPKSKSDPELRFVVIKSGFVYIACELQALRMDHNIVQDFQTAAGFIHNEENKDGLPINCQMRRTTKGDPVLEVKAKLYGRDCSILLHPEQNNLLPCGEHRLLSTSIQSIYSDIIYDILVSNGNSPLNKQWGKSFISKLDALVVGLFSITDKIDVIHLAGQSKEYEDEMLNFVQKLKLPDHASIKTMSVTTGKLYISGTVVSLFNQNISMFLGISPEKMFLRAQESMWLEFATIFITFFRIVDSNSVRTRFLRLHNLYKATGKHCILETMDSKIIHTFGKESIITGKDQFESIRDNTEYLLKRSNKTELFMRLGNDWNWFNVRAVRCFDQVMNNYINSYLITDMSNVLQAETNFRMKRKEKFDMLRLMKLQRFGYTSIPPFTDYTISRLLGYETPRKLMNLLHPDDIRKIKLGTPISIVRALSSNGTYSTYFMVHSKEYDESGFIFPFPQFDSINQRFASEDDFTTFPSESKRFAFFVIDPISKRIVSFVGIPSIINHFKSIPQPHAKDIYTLVHHDSRQQYDVAFQNLLSGTSKVEKLDVLFEYYDIGFSHSRISMEMTSSDLILIYVFNNSKEAQIEATFNDLSSTVDTALRYTNVVSFTFMNNHDHQFILTRPPEKCHTITINWSFIEHNISIDDQPNIIKQFKAALEEGKQIELEVTMIFDRMKHYTIRGFRTESGKVIGILLDRTELFSMFNQIEQQTKRADEANNAKSRYLANMSHEIRTPLNGMNGLLELLDGTELAKNNSEILKCIRTSFVKLLELLNDTLDIAKIDQNCMIPEDVPFNTFDLALSVTQGFEQRAIDSGVELRVEIIPGTPSMYRGEPHFLARIMNNLISNAIRCTERGYVNATLSQVLPKGTLLVRVEDSGSHITPEERLSLFDAFGSLGSGNCTVRCEGTSLALVKRLVDLIRGKINVKDNDDGVVFEVELPFEPILCTYIPRRMKRYGWEMLFLCPECVIQGTPESHAFFTGMNLLYEPSKVTDKLLVVIARNTHPQLSIAVELKKKYPRTSIICITRLTPPVIKGDFIVVPQSQFWLHFCQFFLTTCMHKVSRINGPHDNSNEMQPDETYKILVAEDTPMNQLVISKLLEKLNVKFDIVSNGQEALERLKKEHYSVIFMDHHMPVMDGPTAAREIRRQEKLNSDKYGIPIFAMTASIMKEDEDECRESGMNQFVSKPISIHKLQQAIRDSLTYPYNKQGNM
ncbi:Response regulator receiver domain containing protein [Trichomonas vaginalis G3]|uniref:Response regulator receiver domain containing protein n=1 Tax=Trichomonas vaginalis (strain ATCC PRA-98 / G3) TaxID=412133 RepID=A2DL22_TRIV3|nr:phosphorelay sensor kinase protein [Trichomonas vaginalis G3]EAY18975.1 Response regulator receiver domain containing protein [Trichomonas vaginalis G3]KAI5532042.1 phosphorelay sensor kinase protein [Trichomonas vaginalis G3]|eukprot:XP_001579961.1 Response regulator receiver domain containing protein [Trichomonas vaginalis G3]